MKDITDQNLQIHKHRSIQSRSLFGVLLALAGLLWLLREFGLELPWFLFSWPMILIAVGTILLIDTRGKNANGLIVLIIGCIFLIGRIFPYLNYQHFFWPVLIIGIGVAILLKERGVIRPVYVNIPVEEKTGDPADHTFAATQGYDDSRLDEHAFFGTVKKAPFSKTFSGGELNAVFASIEIDLLNSDFKGLAVLNCNAIFGSVLLRIPAHWQVVLEGVPIFGGIEDKRAKGVTYDLQRKLVIRGSLIFGGLEIKS